MLFPGESSTCTESVTASLGLRPSDVGEGQGLREEEKGKMSERRELREVFTTSNEIQPVLV
jgi:hypothetical protein